MEQRLKSPHEKFKIVETYWHDHSLERSRGALSGGTIIFSIQPFSGKNIFRIFLQKTPLLMDQWLLNEVGKWEPCANDSEVSFCLCLSWLSLVFLSVTMRITEIFKNYTTVDDFLRKIAKVGPEMINMILQSTINLDEVCTTWFLLICTFKLLYIIWSNAFWSNTSTGSCDHFIFHLPVMFLQGKYSWHVPYVLRYPNFVFLWRNVMSFYHPTSAPDHLSVQGLWHRQPLGALSQTLDFISANWLYIPHHSWTHPNVTHVECSSFHCNRNIVPEMHSAR
jgi:hypothetical protein